MVNIDCGASKAEAWGARAAIYIIVNVVGDDYAGYGCAVGEMGIEDVAVVEGTIREWTVIEDTWIRILPAQSALVFKGEHPGRVPAKNPGDLRRPLILSVHGWRSGRFKGFWLEEKSEESVG